MKNIYKILQKATLLLFFSMTLSSCFKDTSTLDNNSIARYVIVPEEDESFYINAFALENVVIKPVVYKVLGTDTTYNVENELDFYWSLGLDPIENDTVSVILSHEKDLNMPLSIPPGNNQYLLSLHATDKKHNIHTITNWRVTMSSIYNGGLLVCDTKDNGETSDVSLIMAPEFSPQYRGKGEVKRHNDIFSLNNENKKLKGAVSFIKSSSINDQTQFTFICENKNSMTRVYPSDFKIMDEDQERFIIPEDYFAPRYFGNGYYECFLVNNGLINLSDWQNNDSFMYAYPLEADSKGYYCKKYFAHSVNTWDGSSGTRFTIYDELNGRFLQLPGKFDAIKSLTVFNPDNGSAFDVNNLPNKTCEMAGVIYSGRRVFILRDKTTNQLSMYLMAKVTAPDNGKLGEAVIDMSSYPDINNVIQYVISSKDETIYYATPKKIYALIMTGDLYKIEERYSAPAGTIITAMNMVDQTINYIYKTEIDATGKEINYTIPLNGRTILFATYNETTKVGSVTANYLELNSAEFSTDYKWDYSGFGRITSLATVRY